MQSKIKEALLFISFLALIFLAPVVSAEIFIGQIDTIYNVGDQFDLIIKVSPPQDTEDFFTTSLLCNEQEREIYRSPYTIKAGEEREILISTTLGKFIVEGIEGSCKIRARYGIEEATSTPFEITRDIAIILNIDGLTYNPGEEVHVFGQAAKSKDAPLEGSLEITIPEIGFNFLAPVVGGQFDVVFTLPDNAKAGSFELKAAAFEKDPDGEIINSGEKTGNIKIRQVMKEIEIALNTQTIAPRNELTYTIIVYDQTQEHLEADVSVALYNSQGTEIKRALIKTDISQPFFIESSASPGDWKIEASVNGMVTTKNFFIEELREASYKLENNTLTITNTGNIPYTGPVEISIGTAKEIKQIENLAVGESKSYKLSAPNGEYTIGVGGSSDKQNLGSATLTGKAISVDEINNSLGGKLSMLLGLLIFLLIAALGLFFYRRMRKKSYGKISSEKMPRKIGSALSQAEPNAGNLITGGEKQEAVVIALKINNPMVLKSPVSEAPKALDSALWKVKESGAKIYSDGDYRIIILVPNIIKSKDIYLTAISVSKTLERMLSEHNKRFVQKIDFGIGINLGQLVVERKDNNKFKFMSIDRTIAIAKKISQSSEGDVLISDSLHRKTVGKARANKSQNTNFWKIEKVMDRTEHEDFISGFMQRQKRSFRK